MPVRLATDFQLNGKGYLLARGGQLRGRAWLRTGIPDTPGRRSDTDAKYGMVPDTEDHPEVWDDWSGGYGQAYRRAGENTYHWAENFDARFPRQLVHVERYYFNVADNPAIGFIDVPPLDAAERNRLGAGAVLQLTATSLSYKTPTNLLDGAALTSTDTLALAGVDKYHRAAVFGSFVYIPVVGASPFIRVNFLGSVNALGVGADNHTMPARAFTVAGNNLWRLHGPGGLGLYLQSCAAGVDPASASNWSATLNILDPSTPGSDLISIKEQVCVGAPNGLYVGDTSGTFKNVLSELQFARHVDNGRDLCIYEDRIIYPHQAGLLSVKLSDPAFVEDISPVISSNVGPVRGHIRAVRNVGPWLMAGLFTGSTSYLLVGRRNPVGGEMAWHTQQILPATRLERIHHDSITISSGGVAAIPNRLWLGVSLTPPTWTLSVPFHLPIPMAHGNPIANDPVYVGNFALSARMDLGAIDWGAPTTPKIYRSMEIWADNIVASTRWCDVHYNIDGGSRQFLGTITKSPKDILYFPSDTASWAVGQSIALSLVSRISGAATYSGAELLTPVYRAAALRGTLRPRSIDRIQAVVRIADGMRDRRGGSLRPGAIQLAELRALSVSTNPVQLIDLAGAQSWVAVQAPIDEQENYQAGDEEPEILATVRMSVMTFSGG